LAAAQGKTMREHIAPALYYIEVHILYASLVCLAAWALTALPFGSARTKYWIWVAAAMNFFLPVAGLIDRFGAERLTWARPLPALGDAGVLLSRSRGAAVLVLVWFAVALLLGLRLLIRVRTDRTDTLPATRSVHGVPVEIAPDAAPPSVVGLWRPRIRLPAGIERRLSRPELDAVLLHEATHAKRRDNLIRLGYEIGLCVFWFHPLVWLAGKRLSIYRELSCDERVLERARGDDLIRALAKLAEVEPGVLQASATSLLGMRLQLLCTDRPTGGSARLDAAVKIAFGAAFVTGVYATVAHTACCFVVRI
jgi:Zn-dependent protease with chaperone function